MSELSDEQKELVRKIMRKNRFIPGVDFFQFPPGEMESFTCPICGAECDVERNVRRLASMYFFAGIGGVHDEFRCPHRLEDAHEEALEIFERVRDQLTRNRYSSKG